jgi:hypothetical protein
VTVSIRSRWAKKTSGALDVVPGRQSGLEEHHRGGAFGEDDAVQLDPDVARGADRVDPRVGTARVAAEDLFVLLEPGVDRAPGDVDEAGEGAAVEGLGRLQRDQRRVDVVDRQVVGRVVRHLPDVEGAQRVDHGGPAERRADPPRAGLHEAGLGEVRRITGRVDHAGLRGIHLAHLSQPG